MTRTILSSLTLVSLVVFPWPSTVFLAVASSFVEPLLPFGIGLLADAFYYAPHASAIPLFSLYGALCTIVVFFVRDRLRTDSIEV